jgi:phospholipase D1/2
MTYHVSAPCRNAQNFLYVENQYFMGSAYEWGEDSQTLCNHTIPAEIVAKIVAKIRVRPRRGIVFLNN